MVCVNPVRGKNSGVNLLGKPLPFTSTRKKASFHTKRGKRDRITDKWSLFIGKPFEGKFFPREAGFRSFKRKTAITGGKPMGKVGRKLIEVSQ